jgi:hypothetical protein
MRRRPTASTLRGKGTAMSSAEQPPNGNPDATIGRFRAAVERLKDSAAEPTPEPSGAPPKRVAAEEFVLVDAEGKARGTLALGASGTPALALCDARGRVRAEIRLAANGAPSVVLYDSGRRRRVEVALRADGAAGLGLYDEAGEGRAELVVSPSGAPALSLFGPDGRRLTRLPTKRDP